MNQTDDFLLKSGPIWLPLRSFGYPSEVATAFGHGYSWAACVILGCRKGLSEVRFPNLEQL